jgi:hypothetical protein
MLMPQACGRKDSSDGWSGCSAIWRPKGTSILPNSAEGQGEYYVDTFRGWPLTPPTRLLMTPEGFEGTLCSIAADEYARGSLEFNEND